MPIWHRNFHWDSMDRAAGITRDHAPKLTWDDDHPGVSAYLDRCQVDTPDAWVERVWELIASKRAHVGKVVEFGAGDGRFACFGSFDTYIGYKVDKARSGQRSLPRHAKLVQIARSRRPWMTRTFASATLLMSVIRTCQMVGVKRSRRRSRLAWACRSPAWPMRGNTSSFRRWRAHEAMGWLHS